MGPGSIIQKKCMEKVKEIVLKAFNDKDVTIVLFGSRAREDFDRRSDIDVGILPHKNDYKKELIYLKDKLENINIPYTVDLVNLSKVSDIFKEHALKEGIIWKN